MIPIVLKELAGLGLHTRILHLNLQSNSQDEQHCHAVRYVWTHRGRRPWGLDTPSYCSRCNSIKSFRGIERINNPDGSFSIQFKCHGPSCTKSVTIPLTAAESRLTQGPRDPYGKWQCHDFQWDQTLLERF
ncbi:hypothetical protein K435DRAFT_875517 [Dendrothele bispora CBS 962.96]|uniref:Uncharacterized protein n=1 Tax=Dendrothele bispora (strain CBS 962.96) TaxID=1314807 RepID=A0A4S8KV75_DENBC|nr:hypothetical protein K435DRAFT_875517 [Dendrothele bispora CBS 962.96]